MEEEQKENHIFRMKALRQKISPLTTIFLSFALIIFVGSIILFLPFSASESTGQLSYIDALFLSVSAVCVTGLSPVVLATSLSIFGKIVMALLIQIGGLGLVTIVSFVVFATGKKFNVSQAVVVKEALSQPGMSHLKPLIKHIIIITASFELLGTVLNMFVFGFDYPFWEALGISVFHAISSFNNAGFDIIGSQSMIPYKDNFLLNFSTCLLIIAGGLGFLVYEDFIEFHKWKRFSIQTKIVLIVNLVLLITSVFTIYGVEYSSKVSFMQAAFYAINLRTAGFASFDLASTLTSSGKIISIILMFIGGSPLSTAGGIKTTSLFVILASLSSFRKGRRTVAFHREIDHYTKLKAFYLMSIGILDILIGSALISLFEQDAFSISDIMFECTSAFGTVGFTVNLTSQLNPWSKIVLCILMFTGRVGPVLLLSMWNPTLYKPKRQEVRYLETDLIIG
jgi:trk system potassium uptake protein TrkH